MKHASRLGESKRAETLATTESGRGRRRNWSTAEKTRCLAMLTESGLSMLAFSRRTGVPYSNLCQWRRRTRSPEAGVISGFAQVRVVEPSSPVSRLTPTETTGGATRKDGR
ncbi:MAG: IS66 family insertion sequence element accessory protein TnpA [Opitutaceae bacterium]